MSPASTLLTLVAQAHQTGGAHQYPLRHASTSVKLPQAPQQLFVPSSTSYLIPPPLQHMSIAAQPHAHQEAVIQYYAQFDVIGAFVALQNIAHFVISQSHMVQGSGDTLVEWAQETLGVFKRDDPRYLHLSEREWLNVAPLWEAKLSTHWMVSPV